ncbi:MAG TPA: hypothetical protein VJ964_14475 [Balneolaceae bacterium]|nr:hypothetical protein [Balneolaceae bacterium]
MNIGLVTSYLIAGIILLAMLSMNMSVSHSSNEITLSQVTRERATTISDMMTNDMLKMGYNRKSKTSPILTTANNNKIEFRSNIDNSTDNSVEIVTWEFTSSAITNTTNPNDRLLLRTIRDASTGSIISQDSIKSGVIKFQFSYYNDYGKPRSDSMSTPVSASNLASIKQIYVSFKLQYGEKIDNSSPSRYVTTIWEKRFSPPNLEL